MSFDISKPYRCRDGRKAKVLGSMPDGRLCGWIMGKGGWYETISWQPDGLLSGGILLGFDPVNVPKIRTVKVWANIYPAGNGAQVFGFGSAAERDSAAYGSGRIAKIEREITSTVGEGLDP